MALLGKTCPFSVSYVVVKRPVALSIIFAYISKERHSCVLKHMCHSLCAGIYYVLITQLWRACFAVILRYRSAVVLITVCWYLLCFDT